MSRWRAANLVCLLVYWIVLFVGTHVPGKNLEGIKTSDKLLHFLGYGGLSFLLSLATVPKSSSRPRATLMVLAVLSLYAAIDEWTQRFVAGRSSEFGDWCADVGGVVLGILCCGAVMCLLGLGGKS